MLFPSAADFGEDGIAVLSHVRDDFAGCTGFFVICAPDKNFQQDRGEVDSFIREPVEHAACIFRIGFGGEDACILEPAQAIREDIGGDAFTTFLKVFETAEAADHEITHEEQGPAISEDFKRDADRAS